MDGHSYPEANWRFFCVACAEGPLTFEQAAHLRFVCPKCRHNRLTFVADTLQHCDFCYEVNPRWAYISQPFEAPMPNLPFAEHVPPQYMSAGWAACDTCADFIDAGDLDGLLAHKLTDWTHDMPESIRDEMVASRRKLHKMFYERLTSGRMPSLEYTDEHDAITKQINKVIERGG